MTNLIKTSLLALFIIIGFSGYPSFAGQTDPRPSVWLQGCSMINVKGNVRLYLKQGSKEDLHTSGVETGSRISFQREGKKVLISSKGEDVISVYITIRDLVRIEVSGNAYVKSIGKFNLPLLQIFLSDQSGANINLATNDLYTVLGDGSSLRLAGSATHHTLIKEGKGKLDAGKFAANASSIQPALAAVNRDRLIAEGKVLQEY